MENSIINPCYSNLDEILEYLDEYCKYNTSIKNKLKDKLNYNNQKVNEIKKILKLSIEDNNNHNFFSPKKKELNFNGKTQDDLERELKDLKNINKDIKDNMEKVELKVKNIERLVEAVDKYKSSEIVNKNNSLKLINMDLFGSESEGIKILETQELERKRIARELHDSTIQNMTNIIHKTELSLKFIDIDQIRAKLELQTMIETIRNTINDMRSIIYDLRPMSLDDLGLIVSVERHINQMKLIRDTNINFNVENEEIKLMPIINLTLFRIIQEACNNVFKHAKANNIDITLRYNTSNIELIITDDGIGFDNQSEEDESNNQSASFGLSMMKERVFLLNGSIEIESEKKIGTTIYVQVPI